MMAAAVPRHHVPPGLNPPTPLQTRSSCGDCSTLPCARMSAEPQVGAFVCLRLDP